MASTAVVNEMNFEISFDEIRFVPGKLDTTIIFLLAGKEMVRRYASPIPEGGDIAITGLKGSIEGKLV